MGKMLLDPNAVVYTDDEIVGKVNAATLPISRVDAIEDVALKESADFQKITQAEEDKLAGIEEGAQADQSGDEIVAAIDAGTDPITREDALSQADLKLVKSEPISGENAINFIVRKADGKLEADYNDVPEA